MGRLLFKVDKGGKLLSWCGEIMILLDSAVRCIVYFGKITMNHRLLIARVGYIVHRLVVITLN